MCCAILDFLVVSTHVFTGVGIYPQLFSFTSSDGRRHRHTPYFVYISINIKVYDREELYEGAE